MSEDEFMIEAPDKQRIYIYRWLPGMMAQLKCIVQISHGMAEHAERYREFAKYLNTKGIGVYTNDHRGHGKTAETIENVGYFADESGWDLVVNDMFQLTELIRNTHAGLPVFLFGHSMGAYLAQDYITRSESDIDGVIMSGTVGDQGILGDIGIIIAKLSCKLRGRKVPDKLLDKLSFGSYNKKFKPARTKFDWLSRDKEVADKYIADEFCGGIFSSGFFLDLFRGIKKINRRENMKKVSGGLPFFFMSGERDPVGANNRRVKKLIKAFEKSGVKDISFKFYKDARHEMLKEINKEEVFSDISGWIMSKLKDQEVAG